MRPVSFDRDPTATRWSWGSTTANAVAIAARSSHCAAWRGERVSPWSMVRESEIVPVVVQGAESHWSGFQRARRLFGPGTHAIRIVQCRMRGVRRIVLRFAGICPACNAIHTAGPVRIAVKRSTWVHQSSMDKAAASAGGVTGAGE